MESLILITMMISYFRICYQIQVILFFFFEMFNDLFILKILCYSYLIKIINTELFL